jgi:spore coat protein A
MQYHMKRRHIIAGGIASAALLAILAGTGGSASAQIPGGSLDPNLVPKYVAPLVKPPAFPRDGTMVLKGGMNADYYEIAVRQFQQQILPAQDINGSNIPPTTVWSYGPNNDPRTVAQGGRYFYPAFTLETKYEVPIVVKWINGLVDANGNYLPHLLPVDQTLHWANPWGPRDTRPANPSQDSYTGPVPMVTHVHGSHTTEWSDGYPEAWYLPAANNIPPGIQYTTGTFYDYYASTYGLGPAEGWGPGSATFMYPNDQRATTLWYHDHTLGMTRVNVYAGPAGFYIIRGGPDDVVQDTRTGNSQRSMRRASLPGPAPDTTLDPFGTYYEIPIAIQDRSFNADGSLFYPADRAFFEGLEPNQLQIPFTPEPAKDGTSDVAPIWQPEFFGNMMVVNGQTWPYLDVEQKRYRFRLLDGCNSRFLILDFGNIPGVQVWQIGAEGGFLAEPVNLTDDNLNLLLMGPAERADVIVDFSQVPVGNYVLANVGPDEPFGGGLPDEDFDVADPNTTGQIMQFRVTRGRGRDTTTPPEYLKLPTITPLAANTYRNVTLNEEESQTVFIEETNGVVFFDPNSTTPFGPTAALCGILNNDNTSSPLLWSDAITENPALGDTEEWTIWNFTADAHPIHIHLIEFQVVNRQQLATDEEGIAVQPAQLLAGTIRAPEPWESGFKDTVIVYPGEVARVRMRFDVPGFYVWHCHIVEHEDNEMMRPYHVGPIPADAPAQ